eukprot:3817164-Pyramimonas_sp.AAC.1
MSSSETPKAPCEFESGCCETPFPRLQPTYRAELRICPKGETGGPEACVRVGNAPTPRLRPLVNNA